MLGKGSSIFWIALLAAFAGAFLEDVTGFSSLIFTAMAIAAAVLLQRWFNSRPREASSPPKLG